MPTSKKRIGGKIVPVNIHATSLDTVSFHSEQSVYKWKYMFQRRVSRERELGKNAFECCEITDLMKDVGLMKTI